MTEYTCGMAGATSGTLGHGYTYAYDDAKGTLTSMTVTASGVSDTIGYEYDALQRITTKTTARTGLTLAQTSAYKTISGNRTSTLISGYTVKANGSVLDSYTYSYDQLGNITAINRNGTHSGYAYDVQNQLTASSEGYINYEYTYDTYGNILSVKKYDNEDEPLLLSTDTYTYGNAQWLDRLTAFNGQTITYDGIGNPLSYYNGSSYTFTWNGRELATATKGSTSVSYKYGADGLRTQKTVGSTVYNYYYADGLLIRQTWGSNYIDFLYDESGSAYSFIYNGTQYYYVRNLQGDVVRILNTSGTTVVAYSYDAWGKCTVTSGASNAIANANPIRYRGYYYDTDTGFYYLQSRYYDPTIKRFISADTYINANGDLLGFNMYTYCGNNPVMGYDPTGDVNWGNIAKAVGVVVGVTAAVALCVATAGAAAVAMGAVSATVATAATTGAIVGGLAAGAAEIGFQCAVYGSDNLDYNAIAIETFSGSANGVLDGVAATATKVGIQVGVKVSRVAVSGLQNLLHGMNKDGLTVFNPGQAMKNSAQIQGGLLGWNFSRGLSTTLLETRAIYGGMSYGATKILFTIAVRAGLTAYRWKQPVSEKIFD